MKGVKFKIANNSKFSIKDTNGDLKDIFSSNTLFSALINNISLMYGDEVTNRAIEEFKDDNFSISSMFIGLDFYNIKTEEVENTLYFVPKPEAMIQKVKVDGDKLEEYVVKRKRTKDIRMISLGALEDIGDSWLKEEKVFDFNLFELETIGKDLACTERELAITNIEYYKKFKDFSFSEDLSKPHVKVNRLTSRSEQFFYQEEKMFKYQYIDQYRIEPFMYFMYFGELSSELKSAINLMVDEGIGGRRGIGMGRFESNQYIDIDISNNIDADIFINLSSYMPLEEELDYLLGYKVQKENGYIYSKGGQPFRKKSIGTIGEGTIASKKLKGQLIDVSPVNAELSHNIYYNGKAFYLGIGGGENG